MSGRLMGLRFPFRIRPGGGAEQAEYEEKTDADLRHLLASRTGDRVMMRAYGAGLDQRLQEPNTAATHALLRHDIERSLRRYLPGVRLTAPLELSSEGSELTVTIEYTVASPATVRRVTLPLGPPGEGP
ncbi:GPW/gp25 family protein [Streptomyces sp. NPDC051018]|uniref:GPW/gp25 family protein n=1 Tax=Streptomyces sp. NPDC051018 TaxID=3365639 RepID=UPI0037A0FFF2